MPAAKNAFAKEKAQLLLALLEQSGKKGYIQSDTILKKFARYRLNEEEKEDIFLEFENAGIQVVFPDSLTENYIESSDEDKSDEFQTLADNNESFPKQRRRINKKGVFGDNYLIGYEITT